MSAYKIMILIEDKISGYVSDLKGELLGDEILEVGIRATLDGKYPLIYCSFGEQSAPALQAFLRESTATLEGSRWCGVCDFGEASFHPVMLIGALKLLKERGAAVSCLVDESSLMEDHKKMLERYEIPLGHPPEETVIASKVEVPIWFDWEKDEPHWSMNARVFGMPLYLSPVACHLVTEIFSDFRPRELIDVHAYKLGMTAHMGLLGHAYCLPVYSVNRPVYRDAALYAQIDLEPWGKAVKKIRWDPYEGDSPLVISPPPTRPLIFLNANEPNCFRRILAGILSSVEDAVVILQSPQHAGGPQIVELMKGLNWQPYTTHYNSYYPTWCEGGVFRFPTSSKSRDGIR